MFEKYTKVDIRNDDSIVFAPPTKYTLLDGTVVEYEDKHGAILQFPTELVQLQKHLMKKEKIPLFDNASIMTNTENFTPFHRAIVDNINPELYTSYGEWMKFIGALGTFENGLELANEYSKKTTQLCQQKRC
jgi:hypothetical protein